TGRNNMWYNLSLLSQLAISFLTPIFMMIFLCTWLKVRFGLGNRIILAGMFLGLGSGFSSVWVYLKKAIKDAEQQQQEYEDQFR
ncbi:MAG: AtpZ/AtpI family protein, partial [Oscillospiraceae bacterium]|nr:AtpZ/AtpI family protein [Oscillospiraceae bacterium]